MHLETGQALWVLTCVGGELVWYIVQFCVCVWAQCHNTVCARSRLYCCVLCGGACASELQWNSPCLVVHSCAILWVQPAAQTCRHHRRAPSQMQENVAPFQLTEHCMHPTQGGPHRQQSQWQRTSGWRGHGYGRCWEVQQCCAQLVGLPCDGQATRPPTTTSIASVYVNSNSTRMTEARVEGVRSAIFL